MVNSEIFSVFMRRVGYSTLKPGRANGWIGSECRSVYHREEVAPFSSPVGDRAGTGAGFLSVKNRRWPE